MNTEAVAPFIADLQRNARVVDQVVIHVAGSGLKPGDHVVLWGAPGTPTYDMIVARSIDANASFRAHADGSLVMLATRANAIEAMRGILDVAPLLVGTQAATLPWVMQLRDGVCCLQMSLGTPPVAAEVNAPGGTA